MKIISYCNHCHAMFDFMPKKWFEMYKSIIEHMAETGEPSIYANILPTWIDIFLQKLEEWDLILTTECAKSALAIYPLALNIVEFDGTQDVEYYHVCMSLRNHEALLVDEKAEEE